MSKRALAALLRTHKEDGWKKFEEGVKTIGAQSIDRQVSRPAKAGEAGSLPAGRP